jgi:hypothetical protein
MDWMRKTLVPAGTISQGDFSIFHIVDEPIEVCYLLREHLKVLGLPTIISECK